MPVSEILSKSVLAFNANAPCTSPPVTKPVLFSAIVPLFTFSTFPFSVSIVRPSPAFTFNVPLSAKPNPSPAFTCNSTRAGAFSSSVITVVKPFPAANLPPVACIVETKSLNCFLFTASYSSVPSATPVIFFPPASMPSFVTLGPSVIVRPASETDVFCVALPTVMLPVESSTLNFWSAATMPPFVPTLNLPPAALMAPSEFTVNLSPEILNAPLLETESLPSIVVVYPSVASPLRVIP